MKKSCSSGILLGLEGQLVGFLFEVNDVGVDEVNWFL